MNDGQLISAILLSACPSSAAHFASRCVICPNTGPKPIVISVYPSVHSYTLGTCTPAIAIAPCERLPSGLPEPGTMAWPNEPIIAAILADTSARCPSPSRSRAISPASAAIAASAPASIIACGTGKKSGGRSTVSCHRRRAARRHHGEIGRRVFALRAGANERSDRASDSARCKLNRVQRRRSARTGCFDYYVKLGSEVSHHRLSVWRRKIKRDSAFVVVERVPGEAPLDSGSVVEERRKSPAGQILRAARLQRRLHRDRRVSVPRASSRARRFRAHERH